MRRFSQMAVNITHGYVLAPAIRGVRLATPQHTKALPSGADRRALSVRAGNLSQSHAIARAHACALLFACQPNAVQMTKVTSGLVLLSSSESVQDVWSRCNKLPRVGMHCLAGQRLLRQL